MMKIDQFTAANEAVIEQLSYFARLSLANARFKHMRATTAGRSPAGHDRGEQRDLDQLDRHRREGEEGRPRTVHDQLDATAPSVPDHLTDPACMLAAEQLDGAAQGERLACPIGHPGRRGGRDHRGTQVAWARLETGDCLDVHVST